MCRKSISRGAFKATIFIYLFLGFLVINFDLGDTYWGHELADLGSNLMDTIGATAKITNLPSSAALVLVLAWALIPIQYGLILKMVMANPEVVDWDRLTNPWWIVPLGWLLSPALIFMMITTIPDDGGGVDSAIFNRLKSSAFYVVLWGIVVWASVWGALVFMTLSVIGLLKKLSKGGTDGTIGR